MTNKTESIFRKKLFKAFILFIFAFLVIFIASEIFVRAYFFISHQDINTYRPSFYFGSKMLSDRRRFKSHPFMPFMPKENDERVIHIFKTETQQEITYDYKNNSLGFRTPEREYEKPANTKRIVTLGGSTTWDGPTNDKTWPALLEKKLNDYYKDKNINIEVINLGVDADISQMSLSFLNMYGIHFEPDLVINYDGVNEEWFSMYCADILPDFSNYVKPFDDKIKAFQVVLPKWAYYSYTVSFLTSAADKYLFDQAYLPDQIWVKSKTSTDKTFPTGLPLYHRNLKLMRATCREYGCEFVASIPHWVKPGDDVQEFDKKTREFFLREGINYLDLQNILAHNDYSIHTDQFHWTEKGLDVASDEWLKKITSENLLDIK